ncbi:DUF418 domain-containing protein [Nocardia seriolae]|nr:DUF418 domain-containing protein [Nocardia seriolae]MTJ63712.1 DUF418 domain-containing protein [Nocardia seriolae]MTJ75837.1 DUF418 domain-containing protein [Nocardia seriolae]MTJ88278.1 DUF418 domain-containing protein [Nocardia seriolae]MTK32264.1 DUF418 domain-containing protein [Nocardia seriolae]MTK41601.1 DUF418 domain-containing protein [Nocardia seriolae]
MVDPKITAAAPRLRGFALGGILLVNIEIMSDPTGFAAGTARTLAQALFHDKFYVLFSFLFGYSLTMQFRAADRAGPLLAAAYAATLSRIIHSRPGIADIFAPAGRLAATVYIGQSIVAALIFTGYGLALAGRLSDWTILAVALGIYLAQLALARRWVRHHRYGPVEYLLRAITYGPKQLRPVPSTVEP